MPEELTVWIEELWYRRPSVWLAIVIGLGVAGLVLAIDNRWHKGEPVG